MTVTQAWSLKVACNGGQRPRSQCTQREVAVKVVQPPFNTELLGLGRDQRSRAGAR